MKALVIIVAICAMILQPAMGLSTDTVPNGYTEIQMEGFQVLVCKPLIQQQPALWNNVRRELSSQLYRIVRDMPAGAVQRLQESPVWVELNKGPVAMGAHVDSGWLKANGYPPQKVYCAEISNAEAFVSWCREQPSMVLHEMAHVYHFKFLPGNPDIHKAYRDAVKSGKYDKALHISGKTDRAYAMTNDAEYFAETAEAFFGTNDLYPFVRAELKIQDPNMFDLHQKLWQ